MFWRSLRKPTKARGLPTKPLLVASVYAPSERNPLWFALQRQFLQRTTKAFDHAVYLNRVSPDLFAKSIIIGECQELIRPVKNEHSRALNAIIAYFREHPEYEHFLILDSDAFPICEGWLDHLVERMAPQGEYGEKLFAAALRVEKADDFPHPCAFFIKGSFVNQGDFEFGPRPHTNLAGRLVHQPGSGIPRIHRGRHVFLPLLRTNAVNVHPLLGAIYGGLFYHHGCGSRAPENKLAARLRYAGHTITHDEHEALEERLFAALAKSPVELINKLMARDGESPLRIREAA